MDGEDKAMGFFLWFLLACLLSLLCLAHQSIRAAFVPHAAVASDWITVVIQQLEILCPSRQLRSHISAQIKPWSSLHVFFVFFVFFFRKIPTTTKEWFMSVLGYFALLGLALGLNSTRIYPSDCWFADSKRDHFTVYTISPFWTPVAVDDGRNHSSSYLN